MRLYKMGWFFWGFFFLFFFQNHEQFMLKTLIPLTRSCVTTYFTSMVNHDYQVLVVINYCFISRL